MTFAEKIKEWLRGFGMEMSDEQLKSVPEPEPSSPAKTTAGANTQSDFAVEFNQMKEQLKEASLLLKQEQEARVNMQKMLDEKSKAEKAAKIKDIIEEAITKHGKIPANNEAERKRWEQMFENDFENAQFVLSKIEPKINQNPKPQNNNSGNQPTQQKNLVDLRREAAEAFKTNTN